MMLAKPLTLSARTKIRTNVLSVRKYTTKLNNGLTVESESFASETATVGVFVKTGSACESVNNNGISNLFQTLATSGTKNRKQQQIAEELENIGGSIRSYTTRDQTVFLAKVLKNNVPTAVDILSDIIQNPQFSSEVVEKQKSNIINQIDKKSSEQVAFDYLHSIAFQGSSFALTVEGTKESLSPISTQDVLDYAKNHLCGNHITVVGAGAVDESFNSLVESKFNTLPNTSYVATSDVQYIGSAVTILDDSHHSVESIIAFNGVTHSSPDYIPLLLIQEIIGDYHKHQLAGNRGSTVVNEQVSAVPGMAEFIRPFNISYADAGLFGVYFKGCGSKIDDLCNTIVSDLVRLSNSASEKEVAFAKNKLKNKLLTHQGTQRICEEIGFQLHAFGRKIPNDELFSRIDLIDSSIIRDVAGRYFTHVEPVSVASGDIYNYPDYNQLRAWTYWNRM